jgi:hypothetical protein
MLDRRIKTVSLFWGPSIERDLAWASNWQDRLCRALTRLSALFPPALDCSGAPHPDSSCADLEDSSAIMPRTTLISESLAGGRIMVWVYLSSSDSALLCLVASGYYFETRHHTHPLGAPIWCTCQIFWNFMKKPDPWDIHKSYKTTNLRSLKLESTGPISVEPSQLLWDPVWFW